MDLLFCRIHPVMAYQIKIDIEVCLQKWTQMVPVV
jgi:hypothetical protein